MAIAAQLFSLSASAQDEGYEEPSFTVNGMLRFQGGVFVPLASSKFEPHETLGYRQRPPGSTMPPIECDVRQSTLGCQPQDHGQKPGTPSILRATLQLEAQWDINEHIGLHAIVRGVRSLSLPADEYARPPQQSLELWQIGSDTGDFDALGQANRQYVLDNYYTELDLREFYLDVIPNDWFSMRIGRQQIMWGDVGGYRLLDAVNPENATWHFGPLEAVEDIRVPNWMWLTTFDMPKIEHSLELLWIPMIDRPKDTVTTPLSFVGAWGAPIPDKGTSFFSNNLVMKYPGRKLEDMRAGLRWKGAMGDQGNYSFVYLYTHQFSPPIPDYGYYLPTSTPTIQNGQLVNVEGFDNKFTKEVILEFPRQHIAGVSLEQAIPSLATIARVEVAVEPNRTFAWRTDQPIIEGDRLDFRRKEMLAVNYAVVLQRPTMIRFLNPTQNFLLVAQFFHSVIPEAVTNDTTLANPTYTQLPGYNAWALQKHMYRVVGVARTSYLHGKITLGLMGVYMPNPYYEDSGFYSIDVGFRIGPHYRLNIVATDFIGKDPYRDLGLYRDRDEIAANLTLLF